jgi:hypothetical protein
MWIEETVPLINRGLYPAHRLHFFEREVSDVVPHPPTRAYEPLPRVGRSRSRNPMNLL